MGSGYMPPPPLPTGGAVAQSPDQVLRQKRLVWTIVIAVVAVVLLVVLFIGGILTIVFGALKSSEPYQHAVHAATTDPRVAAELGAPVKPGWLFSGNIQTSGPSGDADLAIPLTGSKGKGTLYVVAKKSADRWTYRTLELRAEGQPDLDLLHPPEEK